MELDQQFGAGLDTAGYIQNERSTQMVRHHKIAEVWPQNTELRKNVRNLPKVHQWKHWGKEILQRPSIAQNAELPEMRLVKCNGMENTVRMFFLLCLEYRVYIFINIIWCLELNRPVVLVDGIRGSVPSYSCCKVQYGLSRNQRLFVVIFDF